MRRKNWELKGIFWIITLLFVGFLAAPILLLLGKSLLGDGGLTGEFYVSVVTRDGFLTALGNSFAVAETIIRWIPPLTALICAGIALSGFVYYQFFL